MAVIRERRRSYGNPAGNHRTTAELWIAYLARRFGVRLALGPRDVCLMNILQKISRDAHAAMWDNLVDIAGYAENAGEGSD